MAQINPKELEKLVLFNEDCLETTAKLPDESVDLIYADPPFFTGRIYSMNGCSFDDVWSTPDEYLTWVKPRLREFQRILSPTGSIYLHCDWHISHYLKVLSDGIFGSNNFMNEIIWKRQSAHNDAKQGSKHFGRIHDSILVYVNSQKYTWNQQYRPYDEGFVQKTYKFVELETDRRYALGDLTGPGGASKGNPQYEFMGVKRYWRYSRKKMVELLSSGRIACRIGRVPLLKRYLDEMNGKPVQDIWMDIPLKREKKRFPTQKPNALLERIVSTSSNPGQIIYEPFSGSASGAIVCNQLLRRWMGTEISEVACQFALDRLKEKGCVVRFVPKARGSNVEEFIPLGGNQCQS